MTNQESNWLSIREAALAAGVSELTIRRRIKDGRIPHRFVGGKYFVADAELHTSSLQGLSEAVTNHRSSVVPDQAAGRADDGGPKARVISQPARHLTAKSASPDNAPRLNLDALLVDYARLAEIAGRASLLEEQLQKLQRQYGAAQESTLALASRNGWLESKLEEREQAIRLLTDSRPRIPWWRRVFGRRDRSE